MRLTIAKKCDIEIFAAIFQLLKSWSSQINLHFKSDQLFIQTMDKSHICIAYIVIQAQWFTTYECSNYNKIAVDSNCFATMINYALKHEIMEITYDTNVNVDKLYINLSGNNNSTFEHFFEMPLIELDEDYLDISSFESDVEFTIETKRFIDILGELLVFGTDLNIVADNDNICLTTCGDSGKLCVNMPGINLMEYSIIEDMNFNCSYSLTYLHGLCMSKKLSQTLKISLNSTMPMAIKYELGDESTAMFYMAPKI